MKDDEWYKSTGMISFFILLTLLNVAVIAHAVLAQEVGLEDIPQKELTGLPVKEDGVVEQTWNWFVDLLGFEVPDTEVVKRSILEQDLAIEDVRLVNIYDTEQGAYQVIVTPQETYDVPEKTVCYEDGERYVCESTLRCDGLPGIEYGCEHVTVQKTPIAEGKADIDNIGNAPIKTLYTRKEVLLEPELIADDSLTLRLPPEIVREVKDTIMVTEEVVQ